MAKSSVVTMLSSASQPPTNQRRSGLVLDYRCYGVADANDFGYENSRIICTYILQTEAAREEARRHTAAVTSTSKNARRADGWAGRLAMRCEREEHKD